MIKPEFQDEASQTDPPVGVVPITPDEARALSAKYRGTAMIPVKPFLGFYLSRLQAEAIGYLNVKNPNLAGFRIYMGLDRDGRSVAIMVGVDAQGSDLASDIILKTDAQVGGPCPPNCDRESPITTEFTG